MKNHPFSRLFSNHSFIYLWLSQVLSQLTVNLVTFSIITHIYSTTKSSFAVSMLWLSFSLPIFLFGPFSGGLVDRLNLRKTMAITNLLQAISILPFLIIGDNLWLMYLLVLFYSSLDRLYIPAQAAAIPWLVEKPQLPTANGMFFLSQQASILVGFGLGGIFVSLIGQSSTVILSALFLVLAAFAALGLPKKSPPRIAGKNSGFKDFINDVVAGYRLINTRPYLKFPFGLIVSLQAYITVVAVLLPSFTYESLGLDLNYAGILLIIPGALGALIASLNLPLILTKLRKKPVVEMGLLLVSLSLLVISTSWFVPGVFRVALSALCAFILGGAFAATIVPTNTFIQEKTPQDFSGRIYGLLGFFATVATMLPLMLAATLADKFGSQTIMAILSLILLAGYVLVKKKGASLVNVKN